jgi:thiol-disulfide isomerase/thioredoxin
MFLVVLLMAIAAAFFLSRALFPPPGGGSQGALGSALVDPPVPIGSDWRLRSVATGENLSLSSLRGKVVFINIWATWCGPCVGEMPSIASLYSKYQDNPDVAFILASNEDVADVQRFIDDNGYKMPIYIALEPQPGPLESRGIPMTAILDKNQNVRLKQVGSMDWDIKPVQNLLNELSAESTTEVAVTQ